MMWDGWEMMDGWGASAFWMLVAMVTVLVAAWLIVRFNRAQATGRTATDVLGQRFARGEMTKDEYEAARRALGA